MPSAEEILAENGPLSQIIEGFTSREPQLIMAKKVEEALASNSILVIEAGTGTGKTFGYLVPVFLSNKKTIISTATKHLQDQLYFKDIPILRKLFPEPKKVVLLKGRTNYLCLHRFLRTTEEGLLQSRDHITQLLELKEWAQRTIAGDLSEQSAMPEDSSLWSQVTSTADNCLNQQCYFYKECYVVKARQQALLADIIIINHHLFFADMALQEDKAGELLPGAEVVIFDEAHHIQEIAAQFFSVSITGRQLVELAKDTQIEALKTAKDMQIIDDLAILLQKATVALRQALGLSLHRAQWPTKPSFLLENAIEEMKQVLTRFEECLKEAAVRSKTLENCWRRTVQMQERFQLLTGVAPNECVHWYETHPQSFTIQHTPIVITENFKIYLQDPKKSWVFTSATLTVNNTFHLFTESMGLEDAFHLQLKSPFDYEKQAILYVPRGLPDPRAPNYVDAMVEAILPVLSITQGKTFILFTSYKSMEYAYTLLENKIEYPLLLQGRLAKQLLIEEFKRLGNAVLLGTSSFWYGVDVKGEALSCVIIDKLPFSSPGDPILEAKIQLLRRKGKDPFHTYQLPTAVLVLKQGVGRLIRDNQDKGILMICDPRLSGTRYGETFLTSLPNMTRTRDLVKVNHFFSESPPSL